MEPKRIVRRYWDKRSQTYDENGYKSHNATQNFWKSILKNAVRTDENLKILDVGTGTGFLSLLFAEMEHSVTGIDLSKGMLEKARHNAGKLDLTVDFIHGDAENLPFEDETFDIVINRHLLWTIPNPRIAVDEWSRVVKSGGKIMLIDGKWYDSSIDMRLRRFIGKIIVSITEKRNPRMFMSHYARIKSQFPFFNGSAPNDVIDIFAEAGLKNISVDNLEKLKRFENKNRSLSYKISNKPSLFLALGEK
ncbi:MAG TPA: class I SAM-dependent methyltransferase [Methanosarcinaceae archaeon]|nr:class I SAM-dependent methyltransferase [Methanosarcinaceae archaeon]